MECRLPIACHVGDPELVPSNLARLLVVASEAEPPELEGTSFNQLEDTATKRGNLAVTHLDDFDDPVYNCRHSDGQHHEEDVFCGRLPMLNFGVYVY